MRALLRRHRRWDIKGTCRGRGASALVSTERWLPVNTTSPPPSASPRKGWEDGQRLKGLSGDPVDVQGCSALVRTLRKALKANFMSNGRPAPTSFWRKAAYRGGQLANLLAPEEICEVLGALADAKLRWRQDPKATEGLQLFAHFASEEIGSFTPIQMGEILGSFARLDFLHEDLLQAVARTVEVTVASDSGRFSNEAAVSLLSAYHAQAVANQPMLRALSRLFMRRIVREPLTPAQIAKVAIAFSDLRARDVGLFNATTLGLCRPKAVEALSWPELADVAVAYASLRLHSESLFGRSPGQQLRWRAPVHSEGGFAVKTGALVSCNKGIMIV
ncbi:unnamed protein product [Effrenium voratum]|nr:unnamed protein product [Effrenium voratum]